MHTRRTTRWWPDDGELERGRPRRWAACQAPTLRGRPRATQVWRVRLDPQAVCRSGAAVRDEKDADRPSRSVSARCVDVRTRARRRRRVVGGTRSSLEASAVPRTLLEFGNSPALSLINQCLRFHGRIYYVTGFHITRVPVIYRDLLLNVSLAQPRLLNRRTWGRPPRLRLI